MAEQYNSAYTGQQIDEAVSMVLNGSGSGGSSDILNADGIIKQEHLPEGYPYKETKEGYVLPETTLTEANFDEENGGFIITGTTPIDIVEGKEYSVMWNGVAYNCVALLVEGVFYLGDFGAISGGESTGEPFFIAIPSAEFVDGLGYVCAVAPLDGSTTIILSISGDVTTITKMWEEFIPGNKIFIVEGTEVEGSEDVTIDLTARELYLKTLEGYYIFLHLRTVGVNGRGLFLPAIRYTNSSFEFHSTRVTNVNQSDVGISYISVSHDDDSGSFIRSGNFYVTRFL